MNVRASPGVAVDGRFALTVAHVFAIGVAMLVAGIAAAVIGVILLRDRREDASARTVRFSRRRPPMRGPRSGDDALASQVASQGGHAETTEHVNTPVPVLRRRVLLTGLALLALAVLLTTLVAVSGSRSVMQRADDGWYRLMIDLRWRPFVDFSKLLSSLGGTAIDWPIRALVTLIIIVRRRWLALAAWALTVLVSELCIGLIKGFIDRPRPPGSLIATSGASYPSGHAIASAVTAIGIVMALTTGRRRLRWMIAAASIAAAVALSRTYLSAHWLSDVIGGSLIGAGLALTIPEAFEVARDRTSRPAIARRRPRDSPNRSAAPDDRGG
jgi:membrane-associated phospholipid phosphatase